MNVIRTLNYEQQNEIIRGAKSISIALDIDIDEVLEALSEHKNITDEERFSMRINGKNTTDDCRWSKGDFGAYETACGNFFEITDGTPDENNMNYCCYCGKSISA